jgi:hypothetical protein
MRALPLFLLTLFFTRQAYAVNDFQLAAGGTLGLQVRKDYGEGEFKRLYPELLVFGYLATPLPHFWLRTGLRLAYVTEQPEMPKGLRIEERDTIGAAEVGIVYDWYVMPTLSVGGGVARRKIELITQAPIEQKEGISATKNLVFWHSQIGLGLPIGKGFAVVEPFYRYEIYPDDSRISGHYGFEVSFQIL